ncbi:magnesium transporter CorA family protein [archaeon]|nr:magnesium transporter CorA family protein [archaeon]
MIEYYNKKKGTDSIEKIKEFSKGSWINVVNPTNEELEYLVKKFDINEPNLIDALDIHENPRFEIDNKLVYIFLTAPTNKIKHEHDSSFLIVYAKDYFMTVSKYSLEIFERILNSKTDFTKFDNSRNVVKILFFLSRLFEKSVHKILKETKENKAELSKLKNKDIEKLINYEDKLNNYITSFGATIGTYQRILRDNSVKFLRKDELIIEDLIIDLNETLNLCKQTLKTISNMRTYYSTKLSNDLNNTVKLLTIVTIFLSIPTVISSIYGMNINLPLQNSPNLFSILTAIAFGICILFVFFLRKKKVL